MSKLFYKSSSIARYDCKNVIYLAYVGVYNNTETFKYGKSSNVYNREMTSHRKNFHPCFEMRGIFETNYKDHVETLLEKELKIRDMHRVMDINGKKQTELFVPVSEFDYDYVESLVKDIIYDFDMKDDRRLAIELEKLQIERLKLELKKLKAMSMKNIRT